MNSTFCGENFTIIGHWKANNTRKTTHKGDLDAITLAARYKWEVGFTRQYYIDAGYSAAPSFCCINFTLSCLQKDRNHCSYPSITKSWDSSKMGKHSRTSNIFLCSAYKNFQQKNTNQRSCEGKNSTKESGSPKERGRVRVVDTVNAFSNQKGLMCGYRHCTKYWRHSFCGKT